MNIDKNLAMAAWPRIVQVRPNRLIEKLNLYGHITGFEPNFIHVLLDVLLKFLQIISGFFIFYSTDQIQKRAFYFFLPCREVLKLNRI